MQERRASKVSEKVQVSLSGFQFHLQFPQPTFTPTPTHSAQLWFGGPLPTGSILELPPPRLQAAFWNCPSGPVTSPPPVQAAACDLGPAGEVYSSRANQLAPKDRAARVSSPLWRAAQPRAEAATQALAGACGRWW